MKVLLGIPHIGTVAWKMSESAWRCSAEHEVQVIGLPGSLLAASFNTLYCEALNRNEADGSVELFAMLHGDLAPEGFWIDTLVRNLLDKGADLVSVANAIKDERRVTSSGVAYPGYPWMPWRRFTMRELAKYPSVFNAADIGYEGLVLLHNTGCWIADVRKPLFHEEDEDGCLKAYFTIRDRIKRSSHDNKWVPDVEPEDWFFSRRLHDLQANTYISREVVTHHYGLGECDNQHESGNEMDIDVISLWGNLLREVQHADQ